MGFGVILFQLHFSSSPKLVGELSFIKKNWIGDKFKIGEKEIGKIVDVVIMGTLEIPEFFAVVELKEKTTIEKGESNGR